MEYTERNHFSNTIATDNVDTIIKYLNNKENSKQNKFIISQSKCENIEFNNTWMRKDEYDLLINLVKDTKNIVSLAYVCGRISPFIHNEIESKYKKDIDAYEVHVLYI